MTSVHILLSALVLALNLQAQGTVLWNEASDGPLSEDFRFPAQFGELQLGSNAIIGATHLAPAGGNWLGRSDNFTFVIPADSMVVGMFFTVDRARTRAWLGTTDFAQQDGATRSAATGDLLAQFGVGFLTSRGYGMYLANHDAQAYPTVANCRLDITVQLIPEPASWVLLLCGGLGPALVGRTWRAGRWCRGRRQGR